MRYEEGCAVAKTDQEDGPVYRVLCDYAIDVLAENVNDKTRETVKKETLEYLCDSEMLRIAHKIFKEINPDCYLWKSDLYEYLRTGKFRNLLSELNKKLNSSKSTESPIEQNVQQLDDSVKLFAEITKDLTELYDKKNKAYGNSFSTTYQKLGIISAVTRISDKCNRLCNLAVNPDIDNLGESITDTLMDLASYSIMTIMELKKK